MLAQVSQPCEAEPTPTTIFGSRIRRRHTNNEDTVLLSKSLIIRLTELPDCITCAASNYETPHTKHGAEAFFVALHPNNDF